MRNRKYFCPKCQKLWKDRLSCCGRDTLDMGVRWRLPSPKASKYTWKKELNKLWWRIYDPDLEKLYKKYNAKYIVKKGC